MAKFFKVDTGGTLMTGLVSYYNLNDVNDFFATSTMTNNGGATFVPGKVENAVNLARSSSQYLSFASSLGYSGGAYSISGWVNLSSQPTSGQLYTLAAVSDTSSHTILGIGYYNNTGTMTLYNIRSKYGVADEGQVAAQTLSNGTWYHLILTYDGANIKCFLNGSQFSTTASASGNGNVGNSARSEIGNGLADTLTYYMDGIVDEVGFWTKALSAQEISDLYNGGAGNTLLGIGFVSSTDGGTATATSLTYAYNNTWANGALIVTAESDFSTNAYPLTGITYGGDAMTEVNHIQVSGGRWQSMWYILNPKQGNNNVVVSANASVFLSSRAALYNGVKQSGQPDNKTTATGASGTSQNTSLTTVADNCWTIMVGANTGGSAVNAGTGTTIRTTNNLEHNIFDSNTNITPAGSNTLQFTWTTAQNSASIMASFLPDLATATAQDVSGMFFRFM